MPLRTIQYVGLVPLPFSLEKPLLDVLRALNMWKRKDNLRAASRVSGLKFKQKLPWRKRLVKYFYNREKKLFCGRTCKSWFLIIGYSIMYCIFLATYTMIFLYCSLLLVQITSNDVSNKYNLVTYLDRGIGLSATPTSFHKEPLIWYVQKPESYEQYVNSIQKLLGKRRKRDVDNLGPCGDYPYGYGDKPCVIIKINKQLKWSGKPLNSSNENVPSVVRNWMKKDKQKLWLHCSGLDSFDQEHINSIKYYPDPPGFDAKQFPLDPEDDSPLIAIQISDFSYGLSLTIQCSLWYDGGVSTTEFVLYVTDK